MDKSTGLATPPGITLRQLKSGQRIQIFFTYRGQQCRELLPAGPINKNPLQYAVNLRGEIQRKIADGVFDYADYFPASPKAKKPEQESELMVNLLAQQLELYDKQVENGKMSPATRNGYKKSINSERMSHWHSWKIRSITPAALREWVSEMDCTSKAIRNFLVPLRSVMEDALNDGLIDINPFERIALAKLIRQTSKASNYVIEPFSQAERETILNACRPDELPTYQFWFATGLRPGELQALEWKHIDFDRGIVRIEQNQVAGVIKAPKTVAGIRAVELNASAITALNEQKKISADRGVRVWLNPRTLEPWETDGQVRKTSWQYIMNRSGIKYRNPYQIRHTYASALLTAGANPWYVAQQLGHEDVEMVFRIYGKFIREDYQKPTSTLSAAK